MQRQAAPEDASHGIVDVIAQAPLPAQADQRVLNLLTVTTLYPNARQPNHGVFVENRLRHLVAGGAARSEVIAPVPWFPSGNPVFGEWGRCWSAPRLPSPMATHSGSAPTRASSCCPSRASSG